MGSAMLFPVERARELVLRHGWNTTSYQILNPGFRYWFTPEGDGVVGYVPRSRVWVVGGAPICPADRVDEIAERFEGEASAAGANVCYVGAQGRLARRCIPDHAFSATVLGAEPWWDPGSWPALLTRHPSLRAQLNRARNKGVTTSFMAAGAPVPPELEQILLQWLASKGLPPLAFLTTPWLLADLRDRRVVVARREGAAIGFLVLTPIPGREGWLVEQIVRGDAAPNGTAELLVDAAFRWMISEGAGYVTLGLAPLAPLAAHPPVGLRPGPWWLNGALGWLRLYGKRFYNFEGLRSFKAKLGPAGWEPVYAIANEPRFSVRTLIGVSEAVVGGDLPGFGARIAWHAIRTEIRKIRKGTR